MSQSFWVKGKPCSHALFRTAVTEKGGVVDSERVLAAMGQAWTRPMPDWVKDWDQSDGERPWPP